MKLREILRFTCLIALLLTLAVSQTNALAAAPRVASGPIASMRLETTGLRSVAAPTSVNIDQTVTYALELSNLTTPLTSVEFGCYFSSDLARIDNITDGNIFGTAGTDFLSTINGPSGDTFIYAVAGINKTTTSTSGTVLHIDLTGLAAGTFDFNCQVRASTGGALFTVPFSSTTITIVNPTGDGTVAGVVTASKTVTITLTGATTPTGTANPTTGAFSVSAPAGTYTIKASAPGFLDASGSAVVTSGNITTKSTILLVAGDIVTTGTSTNTIDEDDVLAIGNNYNKSTPTEADLNNDGVINVLDLQILSPNFGKTGPIPSAW